jgi:antitoxin MazE
MRATVRKWGNSLGVRVPKAIVERWKLTSGMKVKLDITDEILIVRPHTRSRRRRYKLSELLKQIKPHRRHGELNPSEPVGREFM